MRFILTVLAVLALLPATAEARPSLKKAIWGPGDASAFAHYAELGAGIWQVTVRWDAVAPQQPADPRNPLDPAYQWPAWLDGALSDAAARGIRVMVNLMGAPGWANGGNDWRWAPDDPARFADFAEAASRRFPSVRYWMIWSEPSKALNFQPLVDDQGARLRTAAQKEGPRRYARLLDAGYARLKSVQRSDLVIGGNTFTTGTVRPRNFIAALRLPNGRRPRMDLWGHNPFSLRRPLLRQYPLGDGYADFGDLDTLARWLDRDGFRTPKGKKLRLFLSEYALPTDHTNSIFNFHVTRATQARWLRDALREARRYARIYTLGYLSLYDQDPVPAGTQADWGLLTLGGEQKPAYAVYRDG